MFFVVSLLAGLILGVVAAVVAFLVMSRRQPQNEKGEVRWGLIWGVTVGVGVGVFFVIFLFAPVPLYIFANIYTDHLWFTSIGYHSVWAKRISTQWEIFGAGFVAVFLILFLNARIARAFWPNLPPYSYTEDKYAPTDIEDWHFGEFVKAVVLWIVMIGAALGFGFWAQANWETILLFLNGTSFGQDDPVFGKDIGFYVFDLPFWNFLLVWGFVLWLVVACEVGALHLFYFARTSSLEWVYNKLAKAAQPKEPGESTDEGTGSYWKKYAGEKFKVDLQESAWAAGTRHGSILLIGLFAVVAMWAYLSRLGLVLSDHGSLIEGANVTDIEARSWAWLVIFWGSIISGGLLILNQVIKSAPWRLVAPAVTIACLVASLILFVLIIPAVWQGASVGPNQLERETPNIIRHLEATRAAYGLDEVTETVFPVVDYLTPQVASENQATLDNVRSTDWRPFLTVVKNIQTLRTYFNFRDVDIDRMEIGEQVRQIMIALRDLDLSKPGAPKGWINDHFLFTHSFGVVVGPMNEVGTEGLPKFVVKDIPPTGVDVGLTNPRAYCSEGLSGWVVVNSKQDEFDYPSGDSNVSTRYDGADGVGVGSLGRRVLFAARTDNLRLMLRSPIQADSKIILYRNLEDRVHKIAPFLQYDDDPYIIVGGNGHLVWLWDAYTTSGNYPYSRTSSEGFNYIRGSVKVAVDAYDCSVTFYQVDPEDPIINTWARIFPDLFTPVAEAPAWLAAHFRYPEGLMDVQAEIYARYHIKDPETFFKKEDFWEVSKEFFNGTQLSESQAYYVYTKLPGEEEPEFIIMQTFTPVERQNAIGWLAGRSDPGRYGELVALQFPKNKTIYGLQQIESRINQHPDLSQDITLWNREGSRVIRGNTIYLPIGDTMVAIEPLYLQAVSERSDILVEGETSEAVTQEFISTSTAIPELKRVIVANGDRLVVAGSVNEAFNQLLSFQEPVVPPIIGGPGAGVSEEQRAAFQQLLVGISDHQAKARQALGDGDWEVFGREMSEVDSLIGELKGFAGQ